MLRELESCAHCTCFSLFDENVRMKMPEKLRFEARADADLRLKEFRDGTPGFGGFDRGVELGLVRAWDVCDEVQMALGNGKTIGEFLERNACGGLELACSHAGVTELRGERHGEATGVRRS